MHSRYKFSLAGLIFAGFLSGAASAQDFVWAPDFPVGAEMIAISAQDQNGEVRGFDDLVGSNGVLFMLSRSFDW